MTPHECQRLVFAPELAVIYVLRTASQATCAALAAAYPLAHADNRSPEQELAARLVGLLGHLDRVAGAYCDYIADLPQTSFILPTDTF